MPRGSVALQVEEEPILASNKMAFSILHSLSKFCNDFFIWEARFSCLDADSEESSSVPVFQGIH